MQYKISVIIPIYNLEEYLENSLNSLVNQTIFEQLEIILINDGSSDKSYSICEQFAKKYKNFVLIDNKINKGVSNARNLGIEKATSKYICFCDGDDKLNDNSYETLLDLIEMSKADIAVTDFAVIHSDGSIVKKRKNIVKTYNNNLEIKSIFYKTKIKTK